MRSIVASQNQHAANVEADSDSSASITENAVDRSVPQAEQQREQDMTSIAGNSQVVNTNTALAQTSPGPPKLFDAVEDHPPPADLPGGTSIYTNADTSPPEEAS